MWPNSQFPVNLVTFTEEILSRKLYFLCSGYCLIEVLLENTFRGVGNPILSISRWESAGFVLWETSLEETYYLLFWKITNFWDCKWNISFLRNIFYNFRNFVIKFYIKICLVIIIISLFSSNKELEKQTE